MILTWAKRGRQAKPSSSGRFFLSGILALQNKPIDTLDDQETARAWFAEQLKIAPEEVVFCE